MIALWLVLACRGPEPEGATPAVYTVLAETSGVRALMMELAPGQTTPMHTHAGAEAAYVLAGGEVTVTGEDGVPRVDTLTTGGGSVAAPSTAAHALGNHGPETVRVLFLEIVESPGGPLPGPAPAAFEAAPSVYTRVADGPAAAVYRMSLPPGASDAPHGHPSAFVYSLASSRVRLTVDGHSREVDLPAGWHMFQPPVSEHQVTNIGDGPVEMVLFELK